MDNVRGERRLSEQKERDARLASRSFLLEDQAQFPNPIALLTLMRPFP